MATSIDLKGTVALVTGASRGLGRAMARARARGGGGADRALAPRSQADLERTAEDARRHGVRAEIFRADMREPQAIEAMVAAAESAFGRVRVLVDNAGISGAG